MVATEQQMPNQPGERLRIALLEALSEVAEALNAASLTSRQIHRARRAAKRAASLSRLAPDGLATLAKATRRGVARARRGFGAARDADVRTATIESLRKHLSDGARAELLSAASAAPPTTFGDGRETVATEIAALLRDWSICDPRLELNQMIVAATRVYRRGRRRMKRARRRRASDFHDWRKAVVDDEYQSDFLGAFVPHMRERAKSADRLRRLLGTIHDLDALSDWFDERASVGEEATDALRDASGMERKKLVDKALDLGAAIYRMRPRHWRGEIGLSIVAAKPD